MPDKNPYVEDIRGWNWEDVKKECEANVEKNHEGEYEGRCFLGTVFALYPSGKYYQPFACSNVKPCPKCNGQGSLENPRQFPAAFIMLRRHANEIRGQMIEDYGAWCEDKWPKAVGRALRQMDKSIKQMGPDLHCKECEGCGSAEAYQDELFSEALESVANEHGLWITSGEGDPCDIMAGMTIDEEELKNIEVSLQKQCTDCTAVATESDADTGIPLCLNCKSKYGITVSNGIKVTPEQRAALMAVVDKYYFAMEDVMFGNDDEFGIWGYSWLGIFDNEDNCEGVSEEFFDEIRPLIPEEQILIIECIGHERLRGVGAERIVIGPDGVIYRSLGGPEDCKSS